MSPNNPEQRNLLEDVKSGRYKDVQRALNSLLNAEYNTLEPNPQHFTSSYDSESDFSRKNYMQTFALTEANASKPLHTISAEQPVSAEQQQQLTTAHNLVNNAYITEQSTNIVTNPDKFTVPQATVNGASNFPLPAQELTQDNYGLAA